MRYTEKILTPSTGEIFKRPKLFYYEFLSGGKCIRSKVPVIPGNFYDRLDELSEQLEAGVHFAVGIDGRAIPICTVLVNRKLVVVTAMQQARRDWLYGEYLVNLNGQDELYRPLFIETGRYGSNPVLAVSGCSRDSFQDLEFRLYYSPKPPYRVGESLKIFK